MAATTKRGDAKPGAKAARAIEKLQKHKKQVDGFRRHKLNQGVSVPESEIAKMCSIEPIDFRITCRANTPEEDLEEADEC